MDEDRLERLLRGYRPPGTSAELDRRVLTGGAALLERSPVRETAATVGRGLLDGLGFGYLAWLFDFATRNAAEYDVAVF